MILIVAGSLRDRMVWGLYEEWSDKTREEVFNGYVTTIQARDSDGMLAADDAVGALLAPDGPIKRNGWS